MVGEKKNRTRVKVVARQQDERQVESAATCQAFTLQLLVPEAPSAICSDCLSLS